MSDQAEGLRALVRARSGTTAVAEPREPDRTVDARSLAEVRRPGDRQPKIFAALAARWSSGRAAR